MTTNLSQHDLDESTKEEVIQYISFSKRIATNTSIL